MTSTLALSSDLVRKSFIRPTGATLLLLNQKLRYEKYVKYYIKNCFTI